jgi:phosphoribosyl 1,2-cyclic phosphodiesterase
MPGAATQRYGGNTSCVEVAPDDGPPIIIDAGTGIRKLGKEWMQGAFGEGRGAAHILVSHTHWDHIQGLPFFDPMYQKGNKLVVYARQPDDGHLRSVFASQTEAPYFAVPFEHVAAELAFQELQAGARFHIGPVEVSCAQLNHPWIAIGYRLSVGGRALAYITDTAPFRDILIEKDFIHTPPAVGQPLPPADAAKLARMREGVVRLCENADVVIYDTQFTPEEYRSRPHWGHSCPEDAIEIARAAGAKAVALFHHAPERTDDELDALVAKHRAETRDVQVLAASEGLELTL